MPDLDCSAENCTYNDSHLCCKGVIKVEGHQANDTEDTCCRSFDERREGSYRNSIGEPSRYISIECEAEKCIYNEDNVCTADTIGIAGYNASESDQTECASFQLRE